MVKLTVVKAPKPYKTKRYEPKGCKYSKVYKQLEQLEPGKALRIITDNRKLASTAVYVYLNKKGLKEHYNISYRGIKNPRMFYVSRID